MEVVPQLDAQESGVNPSPLGPCVDRRSDQLQCGRAGDCRHLAGHR